MEKKKRTTTNSANNNANTTNGVGKKASKRKPCKTRSQKEPVKLREQILANGSRSLYLDIYREGKRNREFLKLYLVEEKNPSDKEQNRQTLATAQAIKAKRQIELQNGEYSFTNQFAQNTPFLTYFRSLCKKYEKKPDGEATARCWKSALYHLEQYCDEHTRFKDIDSKWIEGFKEYLDTKAKAFKVKAKETDDDGHFHGLSQNTKVNYFSKLQACFNIAYKEHVIPTNPMVGIERFKMEETERDYLTVEELKRLKATPCRNQWLRRAFLFACLTGLRKCDIEMLTWGEVQQFGDFHRIVFKQKKTHGQEYLDINDQAYEQLGERGNADDKIFAKFKYSSRTELVLKLWCASAGITKDITFHCSRHTFAVMMLNLGAEIFTVSKLLGHRYLSTTQIYAKVVDKTKQKAVLMIPKI